MLVKCSLSSHMYIGIGVLLLLLFFFFLFIQRVLRVSSLQLKSIFNPLQYHCEMIALHEAYTTVF